MDEVAAERRNGATRRQLLRALAASGAAATVSTVTSSVAFADGGTAACRAFLGAATLNLSTVRFRFNATDEYAPRTTASLVNGPTVCPCSGTAPTVDIKWVVVAPAPPPGVTVVIGGASGALAQNTYFPFATNNVVNIASLPDDVAPPNDDLEIQGTFTLTATVRFTCPGRNVTPATTCMSRAVTFGWNGPTVTPDNFTSGPTVLAQQNNVAC
jgi:hypothetical protein